MNTDLQDAIEARKPSVYEIDTLRRAAGENVQLREVLVVARRGLADALSAVEGWGRQVDKAPIQDKQYDEDQAEIQEAIDTIDTALNP